MVLLLLLAACGGPLESGVETVSVDGGAYKDVSVDLFKDMMENKDFLFVNVHIPFEGDIPGTDISIPYNEIEDHLDQLPDKDARIVLYCRSGGMSKAAAKELILLGYTDVWNLDGGFIEWKKAGLPFEE
jgi:rhodanese-related sulfurtransferase